MIIGMALNLHGFSFVMESIQKFWDHIMWMNFHIESRNSLSVLKDFLIKRTPQKEINGGIAGRYSKSKEEGLTYYKEYNACLKQKSGSDL